jgi:hypothetical protein
MIPRRFQGAWRRVSIAVDGGPPGEACDVVWVQAASAFADIRVARPGYGDLHPPASFAGTTAWRHPHLSWRHDLDLDAGRSGAGRSPEDTGDTGDVGDVGRVSWDGDDLVEAGTFDDGGRPVPYVEVWRRMPRSDGPTHEWASPDGTHRFVRAGDHAITVADERAAGGTYRACYRTRHGDEWAPELALGDGAVDLPIPTEETTSP